MSAAAPGEPGPRARRRLRLAYLTSEYPKASHTFVRRELQELERRGHLVLRVANRGAGSASVSAADKAEEGLTFHLATRPKHEYVAASAWAQATRPARWVRALELATEMGQVSERGLTKHLIYLAEAAVLVRHLEAEGIEHVHVHFGNNAAVVARLAHCLGGPQYSMTIHGPDEFDQAIGYSLGAKTMDAAFVVAISDFCSAQLRRWVGYDHWGKIHVVHCAVGEDFLGEVSPITDQQRKLLCIGRLSPAKAQMLLLDAMERLVAEGRDVALVLAGDGEMRGVIEERVQRAGLGGRVEITGWIDEATVRRHLREARALVQPSFAEGLPVVLMEALAMGRPVISTTIAGIPELVRPGENGWLVTAGNVEELTAAMRDAIERPASELSTMGQRGRARVQERHFMSTEVDKLEALFLRYAPPPRG